MEQNKGQEEYYSNFKCYDNKKRRIAIFCRKITPSKLEIFKLTCSKEDQFKKSEAYRVYNLWLKEATNVYNQERVSFSMGMYFNNEGKMQTLIKDFRPKIKFLLIKEDKPLWMFNQYCKNNFYHKFEQTRKYEEVVLMKTTGNDKPILLSSKRLFKLNSLI